MEVNIISSILLYPLLPIDLTYCELYILFPWQLPTRSVPIKLVKRKLNIIINITPLNMINGLLL